jgi:geranylgeranyl diphosphate synthase type II
MTGAIRTSKEQRSMSYPPILEAIKSQFETRLRSTAAASQGPQSLLEAMSYSLLVGGKRVRPVLLLATREMFPPGGVDPIPAACAIEFIHTYSLIHDDLPAMDNDDYRRGKPTSHKCFGEAMAILAGDALLTEAFGMLARAYRDSGDPAAVKVIAEIATAAGSAGMVGGQVLDTLSPERSPELAALERTHRMKTGALLLAPVRCGAILGGATTAELEALTRFGRMIGLAFQVVDDILDVVGTRETLGKTAGKDQVQGKATYPALMGLQDSRRYALELTDAARSALAPFGGRAEPLYAMARFISDQPSLFGNARSCEPARSSQAKASP